MDEYEHYEAEREKRRKENSTFLIGFSRFLQHKKLSEKAIDRHVDSIDFYINEFLLYEEALEAKEGVLLVGNFLGYWFIKKAMWASVTTVKEYIPALKHFYTYMVQIGQVKVEELAEMKMIIKEEKDEWLETLRRYDDPDYDLEDVWGEN